MAALGLQREVLSHVHAILGGEQEATPSFLMRPGKHECRQAWPLVCQLYTALANAHLPDVMPPRERRSVDSVVRARGEAPRIIEFDESQHFNRYRAKTLELYPLGHPLGFSQEAWLQRCGLKRKLEGGGFARPRPPLFPAENGRHQQRAYRDALCDLLPPLHGFLPTLRIADFEVAGWIHTPSARLKMSELLRVRLH